MTGCRKDHHQCPLEVGSKLPLPLYADVRLHIPMTHHHGRPTGLEDAFTQQPQLINWDVQSNHQWASVSPKDLAKLMKYVKMKTNRHIVSLVAQRARLDIVKRFSREAVADLVLEKLVKTQASIIDAKAKLNGRADAKAKRGNPAYGRKGF